MSTALRELTNEELEEVEGAFWANVAGATVGALSGGLSGYLAGGGSWRNALQGAVVGGAIGLISPLRGFAGAATALRTLHASAVGGVAAAGIDRAVYGPPSKQ